MNAIIRHVVRCAAATALLLATGAQAQAPAAPSPAAKPPAAPAPAAKKASPVTDAWGIPVYPGSQPETRTTELLKSTMNIEARCFRSDGSVADIAAYYASQPGFQVVSQNESTAMLRKEGFDVTVQRPWLDMRTGALNKDALLSIVKR